MYAEEDTYMSYEPLCVVSSFKEEEDTCMSYYACHITCHMRMRRRIHACHMKMRRRIHGHIVW
jgi:hypothetical protein